jgi:hypothetical protein
MKVGGDLDKMPLAKAAAGYFFAEDHVRRVNDMNELRGVFSYRLTRLRQVVKRTILSPVIVALYQAPWLL